MLFIKVALFSCSVMKICCTVTVRRIVPFFVCALSIILSTLLLSLFCDLKFESDRYVDPQCLSVFYCYMYILFCIDFDSSFFALKNNSD